MNNEKMGRFISELRKSKGMTQKDLASKLNITDKAVSKWERGLSCPDITLLPALADMLDVTAGELLSGEKNDIGSKDTKEVEATIDHALEYAGKSVRDKSNFFHKISGVIVTSLVLIGILVCAICDLAMTGTFTWSLYPISSAVFGWLVLIPLIAFGKKGILGSMASLTVFIIPYLWVLSLLIKTSSLMMPISVRMAAISLAYLWCIYGLFRHFKRKPLMALASVILLALPVNLLIKLSLSRLIGQPLFEPWDILTFTGVFATAAVLFLISLFMYRNYHTPE